MKNDRSIASLIVEFIQFPDKVISMAKLCPLRMYFAARISTSFQLRSRLVAEISD